MKNTHVPVSFRWPIRFRLRDITSQETYRKFCYKFKTYNLYHHKCAIMMKSYLIRMESGGRWFSPTSYSQVTGYGRPIVVKEHHYGAHISSLYMQMETFYPPSAGAIYRRMHSISLLQRTQILGGLKFTDLLYGSLWVAQIHVPFLLHIWRFYPKYPSALIWWPRNSFWFKSFEFLLESPNQIFPN